PEAVSASAPIVVSASSKGKSGAGRFFLRFFVFVLFVGVAATAFYGGMKYQSSRANIELSSTVQPPRDNQTTIDQKRAAVDADPQKWLNENVPAQVSKEAIARPIDSRDSEFL